MFSVASATAAHTECAMTETNDNAGSREHKSTRPISRGSAIDRNPRQNPKQSPGVSGHLLGYARVSRADQNLERQRDALRAAGCVRLFVDDGVSGAQRDRPGLDELLAYAREGDVIVVQALDRLGRSTRNLLELVDSLTAGSIGLQILNLGVDTRTPAGQLVLTVMAALSQMERDQLRERTLDGLAAARARGRIGGRPPALSKEQIVAARRMKEAEESVASIARVLGVSERTVRRVVASGLTD